MNVLVIGKGGREHAIVRKLSQSPSVKTVNIVPGNPGMKEATCWPSLNAYLDARSQTDLAIIGPEAELLEGMSDQLRSLGIPTFGPSREAAELEGSKKFSKEFMMEYAIPCGKSVEVESVDATMSAAKDFDAPFVLKASGLCAGKGVFICKDEAELQSAAQTLFEDKAFGEAGSLALLEEFLEGDEISYFVLTNGKEHVSLPVYRDHKRLLNNDEGPNTGGMGVVGPIDLGEGTIARIENDIVKPTINGFQKRNFDYRGVVFIGIMLTKNGPKVLEYNVRFGDPEAQCIFGNMESDLAEALLDIANDKIPELKFSNEKIACVVLAAPGYPDSPTKGDTINGDFLTEENNSYGLAAGVSEEDGIFKTNGGRVLGIMGTGDDFATAIHNAYARTEKISWEGMQKRTDIGKSLL